MRRLRPLPCIAALAALAAGPAAAELQAGFELALEQARVDGITLGDDPGADRRDERSVELEADLEYALGDDAFLFYTGAAFAEKETLQSVGADTREDGIEHRRLGVGVFFGDAVQGRVRAGRIDVESDDAWWTWVDDEVDALELRLTWRDVEALALLAEAQWKDGTAAKRIDPEADGVRHALLALAWEFAAGQTLGVDLLRQRDRSSMPAVGEQLDAAREDEVDADLDWLGLRYRGLFEVDELADFEVELYRAGVDGEAWQFDSDDAGGGRIEIEDRTRRDVSASATAWRLGVRPARWADWRLRVGALSADGDADEDDGTDRNYRQSGIHGDNEIYGVLYQPAPVNLELSMIALDWRASERVTAGLARYEYRKRRAAGEAGDNEIELDAEGVGRRLGSELDLFVAVELPRRVDLRLSVARFDAGPAYDNPPDDRADYLSLELDWAF